VEPRTRRGKYPRTSTSSARTPGGGWSASSGYRLAPDSVGGMMRVRVHFCGCAAIAAVLTIAPAASAQIVLPPLPLSGLDTSTPAKPVPASFSKLFTETLGDLMRLPSRENLT